MPRNKVAPLPSTLSPSEFGIGFKTPRAAWEPPQGPSSSTPATGVQHGEPTDRYLTAKQQLDQQYNQVHVASTPLHHGGEDDQDGSGAEEARRPRAHRRRWGNPVVALVRMMPERLRKGLIGDRSIS
jgi:hypothetical protein